MSVVSPSAAPSPELRPSVRVPAGTTARTALAEAGVDLNGPDGAVVVRDRVDGSLLDLDAVAAADLDVEPVAASEPDGLAVIRHSTAHVMAQAVQELFPGTLLGIGPPIENGFYYDFLPDRPFTPDDLAAIEKKMSEIIKAAQRFCRRPINDDDARAELAHEKFKLELIGLKGGAADVEGASAEVGGGALTMYDNVDAKSGERVWTDLCRGPHLPTTRRIPAFQLMRSAAAYWRGNEKNPQLQRIYGTAWATRDDLKAYLGRLEEAAKRDHRKLGAELDLFSFPDELGSGLAVFHPKGGVLRKEMEDYSPRQARGGRLRVRQHPAHHQGSSVRDLRATSTGTPTACSRRCTSTRSSTRTAVVRRPGQDYYLKPMNCPMHSLIFRSRGRSYRELPLRLFEFGSVYRYEKSGVIHGLTRVRGMTQDDAHIYVTTEQMADELRKLLTFVLDLLSDYGLDDFYLELSTKNPEKYVGDDEDWESGDRDAAPRWRSSPGSKLVPDPGGAAFYGPKISVQARDAIGRTWQMSTIQLDFNLPERFELEYQGSDGERHRPVMIHRALFGSIERFFGVLTEHYAGAFPAWLSPVQVIGIPISDEQVDYLRRGRRPAPRGGHPGRGRRLRRPDAEEDPERAEAEGAVHAHRRRLRRRGGCGVLPLPRRRAAQPHPDRAGGRRDRRRDRPPEQRLADRGRLLVAAGVTGEPEAEAAAGFAGDPDTFGRLWTPHRMAYIAGEDKPAHGGAGDECPFCRAPSLPDEDGLIVARGERRVRGAEPVPVQLRAPDGGAVPARRRLHRSHARPRSPSWHSSPRRRCAPCATSPPARVQHRHEPGRAGRGGHRGPPAPARRPALGRGHELHADRRAHPGAAPAARRRPAGPGRRVAGGRAVLTATEAVLTATEAGLPTAVPRYPRQVPLPPPAAAARQLLRKSASAC